MVKTVFEWTFYVSVSSVSCSRELDMEYCRCVLCVELRNWRNVDLLGAVFVMRCDHGRKKASVS